MGNLRGDFVTDAGFAPVRTLAETQRAHRIFLGQVAVFAIGATSSLQLANFTVTVLSVVCLLLVPGFLLMTHRGVDLVPLVLAALGWISFLASCLVNGVSVLWPNAIAPAAFALYLIGLTVLTGRRVDLIATVLAGIAAGTLVFFLTEGIELTHTGSFLDLWKYGIAQSVTILILFGLTKARVPPLVQPVVLALLGLASLGLNFRSHALVCLLASATLFAHRFLGSRIRRGWQFAGIIGFGLVFAYVMPIAARAGLFGPALQRKIIEQEATNLPMLLAGRTEPPMTITAILERPLLGWGSAKNLTPEFYTQAEHLAVRMGFAPTFPFDALLAVARLRLLRDALDPVGFLGRRRRAGCTPAGLAVGCLPRHRLEPPAVRTVGSTRRNCCPARDLGSPLCAVDVQHDRRVRLHRAVVLCRTFPRTTDTGP